MRAKRDCQCPRANHQHGTIYAYDQDDCRCLDCTAANTKRQAERRRLIAYGRWPERWDAPVGTIRRLEGLVWMGYTPPVLAEMLDVNPSWVRRLLRGVTGDRVHVSTRDKIADLFDHLTGLPKPTGRSAQIARSRALRSGFVSPWAWNDIDNPADRPRGIRSAA